ncbi:MAG: DEAD/DEAH box helicase family protein [Anaerolineaceae bacterium]|nr:DEAD/DEAH box helicase family protein [Anaerolineaceae bacterium]
MSSMVALDLETTGLDAQSDAIIEIGAVRFSGHRKEDEWSTLLNPRRPIPAFITQLTGITNQMVMHAPTLAEVLPKLEQFVGRDPVLGHNVQFDLGFLQKQGILEFNQAVDTFDLASVLLPQASRYSLDSLEQQLGLLLPATHRALDDARATHGVYVELVKLIKQLPIELLAEIVRYGEEVDWGGKLVFRQALAEAAKAPVKARQAEGGAAGPLFAAGVEVQSQPLTPAEVTTPLDLDELAATLEHGGPFDKHFKGYEHRPQQVAMLRAVARAISDGRHLMVEAGTGIGKSYAYLVPAATWSLLNGQRVVISTNTINLQDQLIKKDIPDLCAALGIELRAAVLKGRSNYLCPRRVASLRAHRPETVEELRVLAKILIWLRTNQSGDRSELTLTGPSEREVWHRLSAEDEGCKGEVCLRRMGGSCPFYRARQAALNSHILVVNHALLLADATTKNRVLPEFNHLVVDEAHHLEDATTSALSFRVTQGDILRLLRELGGPNAGTLGKLGKSLEGLLPPGDMAAFNLQLSQAADKAFQTETYSTRLFQAMDEFLSSRREGQPALLYSQQERIQPATRSLPGWSEVEIAWDNLHHSLAELLKVLEGINRSAGSADGGGDEELEDLQGDLAGLAGRIGEIDDHINKLVSEPTADYVYWVDTPPQNNPRSNFSRLALQSAPLHIGSLMEQFLWHEKASIVLTSATLTTSNEFTYLRGRLNADEADEMTVGSPFDYENSALLYTVNDIPEPGDVHGHQRATEAALLKLAKATGGRMMALFTSYTQLRKTSQAISPLLAEDNIQVYEQGEGASPNALLESFKGAQNAVLLGTRAFWEGVDIPGEALSVLVIVKLPFDVPSDPIVAARAETFEDPFNQYNVPEAILRFRQGFGRLIRTQSDRGVVVILDRRVLTKKYGKAFLASLPGCTRREGPLFELPKMAQKWLNL